MTSSYTPTTVAQGFGQETAMNVNFTAIKTALDESKSRISTTNEAMSVDLDMGGNDILNAGSVNTDILNIQGTKVTVTALNATNAIKTYATIALMKVATDLSAGDLARTQGYTTAGDNGAATYLIETAAQFGGTPDEFGDHTLDSGDIAVLQEVNIINPFQFGAVGDGVADDTTFMQAAINRAALDYVTLYIQAGTYLITTGLTTPSPVFIEGEGAGLTILKLNAVSTVTFLSFGASTTYGKLSGVRGIEFVNAGTNGVYCIKTPAQADQFTTFDQKFLFEHIAIRGDTFKVGAYFHTTDQTFTTGHLFIGDCKFAVVRDIKINGGFDPNATSVGQVTDIGIVIDPADVALTVRLENLEIASIHTAFNPNGNAFYSISEFDFIGTFRGIRHIGGNEAKIHTGIINAQETGIFMQNAFSRSITNVDVQRLSSGFAGATHDWHGMRFDNVDDVNVLGCKFAHGSGAFGGGFNKYNVRAETGSAGIQVGDCNHSTGTEFGVYLDAVTGFSISNSILSASTVIKYIFLANSARYGNIKGVMYTTVSITHVMISDDASISYFDITEDITGFNRLNKGATLEISTGSVTPTHSFHIIDTEGDISSDDLDTIVAPSAASNQIMLSLRAQDSGRTIVLKDGTGNLRLAGDFSLDNAQDWITLVFEGTVWKEVSRSNNA